MSVLDVFMFQATKMFILDPDGISTSITIADKYGIGFHRCNNSNNSYFGNM